MLKIYRKKSKYFNRYIKSINNNEFTYPFTYHYVIIDYLLYIRINYTIIFNYFEK